jgi:hypothetical protein
MRSPGSISRIGDPFLATRTAPTGGAPAIHPAIIGGIPGDLYGAGNLSGKIRRFSGTLVAVFWQPLKSERGCHSDI